MTVPACLILRSLSYSLEYTLYALNCWNVGYKVVKCDAKKLPGLKGHFRTQLWSFCIVFFQGAMNMNKNHKWKGRKIAISDFSVVSALPLSNCQSCCFCLTFLVRFKHCARGLVLVEHENEVTLRHYIKILKKLIVPE